MDASSTQSVNILETFGMHQYRIYKLDFCSYCTISTSFYFRDLVKGRLMCIVLLSLFFTTKFSSTHQFKNHIELFSTFLDESRESQM